MNDDKIFWLTRRLKEIKKNKQGLAAYIGVNATRFSELEKGMWKFQASHIKKVAEFLEFDRTAFLDFISGDITEDELWNYRPPRRISDDDIKLLNAVKTLATRQTTEENTANPSQSTEIQAKSRERD